MTDQEYFAHKAMSSTELKMMEVPAEFKAYQDGLIKPPDSDALLLGTITHTLLFQPEEFKKNFCVLEKKLDLRKKEDKAYMAEFQIANMGKEAVTLPMYQKAVSMVESVLGHSKAYSLLKGGIAEEPLFWEYPLDEAMLEEVSTTKCIHCFGENPINESRKIKCSFCGVEFSYPSVYCKCKPDYATENYILDLKTTQSVRFQDFKHQIFDRKYYLQASFYRTGVREAGGKVESHYFIGVEKEPPYLVRVFETGDTFLAKGDQEVRSYLHRYRNCMDLGLWPGYEEVELINI